MILDPDQCYRALRTHDARFDGRFFVGVGTTGIYCRPVCTAKTPLERNCTFFPSAAAAESRGYRPCLRCRPELAPGYASVDANRRLAQAAAGLIEDGRLEDASLADLAATLGVTDRHLRRVFQQEFGVSPVDYAQTQRLLLAKRTAHRHGASRARRGRWRAASRACGASTTFSARATGMTPGEAAQVRAGAGAGGPDGLRPRLPPALRLALDARLPGATGNPRGGGRGRQALPAAPFASPGRSWIPAFAGMTTLAG